LPSGDVDALKGIDAATARELLEEGVVSGNMMAWLVNDFAKTVAPKVSQPTQPVNEPELPPVNDPDQTIRDLQTALATPEFQQLLQELSGWDSETKTFSNPRFEQICEWLAKMVLLEGVPFKNLVPASNMLPKGSIRFFYIDPNLSKTMIDGAMSVAGQTSRDTLYYAIMRDVIREAVSVLIHQVRQKVLGQQDVTLPDPSDRPITGFLLRSDAVSGWPGLEVKAFKNIDTSGPIPNGKDPINLLRMQRLAADVLIVLFPETPAWVQIDEPKEGLAFGVEDGEGGYVLAAASSDAKSFTIHTSRDLTADFPNSQPVQVTKSPGNNGTYTIASTAFDQRANTFTIVVNETVPAPTGGGLIWEPGSNFNPIWIRHLVGTYIGWQFGTNPATDAIDATSAIEPNSGVVNLLRVRQLLAANSQLAAELSEKTYAPGELTPGDFALQMVKLPERMIFDNNPS
jgi:hypothetical protein